MKIRQCDRCKKILNQENKVFTYTFGNFYNDNCYTNEILQGDFCYSCYKKFINFIMQEEPYDD